MRIQSAAGSKAGSKGGSKSGSKGGSKTGSEAGDPLPEADVPSPEDEKKRPVTLYRHWVR